MHLDDDSVVPGVVRVVRERLALGMRGEVDDLDPSLEPAAVSDGADDERRVDAHDADTETTSDGATVGWMSIRDP